MIHALDHVVLVVRDLDEATGSYTKILGRAPSWRGAHPALGTENALFRLANGYLELLAPTAEGPFAERLRVRLDGAGEGLFALAFAVDDAERCAALLRERGYGASDPIPGEGRDRDSGAERRWKNVLLPPERTRGVAIFCIEHLSPAEALPLAAATVDEKGAVAAFDHVVVNTPAPDSARSLYGDGLGLRLALDKTFDKFGARMMFFRTGGVTIEVVARLDEQSDPDAADALFGLAWRVPDASLARARMAAAGLDVSEPRSGRKPGTTVFSLRPPTHGVPTLVLAG